MTTHETLVSNPAYTPPVNRLYSYGSGFALLLSFWTANLPAQKSVDAYPLTKERELIVVVDVSFGTLIIERGPRDKVAVVEYEDRRDEREKLGVTYDLSGSRGKLRIKTKRSGDVWEKDDNNEQDRRIRVQLTEQVPITFELELGAGRGELDLTGLQILEFRISTGASRVRMWCNQPNPISAERVEIESGVSKFTAENLSNLNFRTLTFQGGVGTYALDFGGRLLQSGDVDIDLGLGAITVDVPEDVDVRLKYDDNWFSKFDLEGDFRSKRDGIYETVGYQRARYQLTIKIDSGLGSVKVRRR